MKQLKLTNPKYRQLEAGYGEWLSVLGYAGSSVYSLPLNVREFLYWLEQQGITNIKAVSSQLVSQYLAQLKQRPNERREGSLSPAYLNKHLQALRHFGRYLKETRQATLGVDQKAFAGSADPLEVLSIEEVQRLYRATDSGPLGLRDRAMLMLYYGCGLRRSEGSGLNIADIHLGERVVHVRKSKTGRARYVPLSIGATEALIEWLNEGRRAFEPKPHEKAFFLNVHGGRITGQALAFRLKLLAEKAEIEKAVTLHGLRHAIATHLLEAGMSVTYISHFLGHKSLESTQIYTHISTVKQPCNPVALSIIS